MPALVTALGDSDSRVRELAAQAVQATGADGAPAVPALIRLLGSASEGDRNTACIALAGIGPAAKEALPALRKALTDPTANVRGFAKHATERIERAHDQLLPFRDTTQGRWGYKRSDGGVAIPPRYLGAGMFGEGRAPVKDADGFAVIDDTGRIVERIVIDSVSLSGEPVPPPADTCAWSASAPFPSIGLQCYARQLRGSAPVVGGEITIGPPGGESARSAVVLKFSTGVVMVEGVGYEGFTRRVLLPGVTAQQALEWRLKLYPNLPMKEGCSESWNAGNVPGGAFIEQVAGC